MNDKLRDATDEQKIEPRDLAELFASWGDHTISPNEPRAFTKLASRYSDLLQLVHRLQARLSETGMCNCGRFPGRHETTRLCNLSHNGFLGEVQHRLIQDGYDPPVWPDTIRDQGDIDAALDSCVRWCKDRLDERREGVSATRETERCEHGVRWPHECSDCERELAQRLATPSATLAPHVDGQDFYELCQQYRHAKETMPYGVPNVVQAFDNLREYIKTGKLPWPSYEREAG